MINDVPSGADFTKLGLSLLDQAWEIGTSYLRDLDDARQMKVDTCEAEPEYWKSASVGLGTALAIVQQGAEFLVKGKIAEISPYLLISGSSADWSNRTKKQSNSFGDFYTIDAKDLVNVHDTFASEPLDEEFVREFERLRKKRNGILHTIDRRISVHIEELLLSILLFHHYLVGSHWIDVRTSFLESAPVSQLHSADHVWGAVVWEFSLIAQLLKPKDMKRFFNFNKKQRRYHCPECRMGIDDWELDAKTAILLPNTPASTNLWCFICRENMKVRRDKCKKRNCPGNVLSDDYGACLTCLSDV